MSELDPGVPQLDDKDLAQRIFDAERVVVLFYTDASVHCKRFVPAFRARVDEFACEVVAANISDRRDPRWDTYKVGDVPTVVVYEAGRELARTDNVPGVGLHGRDIDRLTKAVLPL